MRSILSLLRRRNFALLFAGRCVSFLGNAMAPVALAFAVLHLTGSASALGIVLAARIAPNLVFLLVGGSSQTGCRAAPCSSEANL